MPRPISTLTESDMNKIITGYTQWAEEGEVQLVLDLSQISPQELNAAASFFVLDIPGNSTLLAVDQDGTDKHLDGLPRGKLRGELPNSKWPPALALAAQRFFGPYHQARARIFLSPRIELRIYRLLAAEIQQRRDCKGASFRFRFQRSAKPQGLDIVLVDVQPPLSLLKHNRKEVSDDRVG
jgi:hypothetical protein